MTASLVIFIVCLAIFLIFSFLLCAIIIKRKKDEDKSMSEIEKGRDGSTAVRPPARKRKIRPDEDGLRRPDIHILSPKMVTVPFNSPNQRKYRRKDFQPMNREFKEKKRKRAKKSRREKGAEPSDRSRPISEIDGGEKQIQASQYYNSQVSVCPLNFSDKIYTRNHITETLFAGSIHRGIKEENIVSSKFDNQNKMSQFLNS